MRWPTRVWAGQELADLLAAGLKTDEPVLDVAVLNGYFGIGQPSKQLAPCRLVVPALDVRNAMSYWYVYVVYELDSREGPYNVKVGHTNDPLRRLRALQAGNPRFLRTADFEQMPTKPFGFRCVSKDIAMRLERAVHDRLRSQGLGYMSDVNYDKQCAFQREWFSHCDPHEVWLIVIEEAQKMKLLGV